MHKYQLLRLRADEFHAALQHYAKQDEDVEHFLGLWMPWYELIQRKELLIPCYDYQLSNYFVNPDLSPLAERYFFVVPQHPLARASVNFSEAIGDWLSDPGYLARLRAAGETPSAILTEEPSEKDIPVEKKEILTSSESVVAKMCRHWFTKLKR